MPGRSDWRKSKTWGNIAGGAIIIAIDVVAWNFDVAIVRYGNSISRAEHPVLFQIAFWSIFAIGAGAMLYGISRLLRGLD